MNINKKKIINDPVYGFINIPSGIIFDLIEHPYFQRLRRIKQLGLSHYVYPGAFHTRFHHAIGALHLMNQAIEVLRFKGVKITEKEATAVLIAILLHDIGHGPFSHTLENSLINVSHEKLSEAFMEALNEEFDGKLSLAIKIFKNNYSKRFLHQLISGQLDMDRMDYLNRDSFFTGVYEGVIGYDRIIKMLHVQNGELVVEEKGIYSIEKFLIARKLMYWQVYLHKTVLSVEQMLLKTLQRAKYLAKKKVEFNVSDNLKYFLYNEFSKEDLKNDRNKILEIFAKLDDVDIMSALKNFCNHSDFVLSFLAKSIINRRLFRLEFNNIPFKSDKIETIRRKIVQKLALNENEVDYLIFSDSETNRAYNTSKDEINILLKGGKIMPMSKISEISVQTKIILKYYLCFPKSFL